MKVDVHSLDTFNQLAYEGAQAATQSLREMTGIDSTVEVTRISLVDRADLGDELGHDTEYVGVQFEYEGVISGVTVLIFDTSQRDEIVSSVLPGVGEDEPLARSSVEEIGNIMMSGFIGGWADYLEAKIDHTPPEYIERTGENILPATPASSESDQVFVFRSEIESFGDDGASYFYMIPEYEPLAQLMAEQCDDEDEAIPVEKYAGFNQMTRSGAEQAAQNIQMLTDIDTCAEVSQLSFSPIEDVPKSFDERQYIGTVVEFDEAPSGFLTVLFDEDSAMTVAEALMPIEPEGTGLTSQHELAIEEIGNIVTSGFLDGWANVLERKIDHSPPRLVHDMGSAIIEPLVVQLGTEHQHAFVVDARMVTPDMSFECEVHVLPDTEKFREALEDLDLSRTDAVDADVDQVFGP